MGVGPLRTCSTLLSVPVGNDTFTAIAYTGLNGTGSPLVSSTVTQQIYLNATNKVSLALPAALADTITAGLYASAAGNTVTMLADPGATALLALTGGTGAYAVAATCPPSILTLTLLPDGYHIHSSGIAGTCNITIGDGLATLSPAVVNVVSFPSPSPNVLNFNSGLGVSAQQSVTISGGVAPFTISASPAFLTTGIAGNVLNAYPNSAGSGTITLLDSLGGPVSITATATTVTVPIASHH